MSLLPRDTDLQGEQGKYWIDRVLLYSAMGMVYLGHSHKGKHVIIKTARYHGDGRDHVRLDLLEVEVEVLRLLEPHENIVGYVDTVRQYGQLCLVLEFLESDRLFETFSGRPGEEGKVKELAESLLSALAHLHRNGILHRDVTPLNIMIHPQRRLVLLDFGTLYVMRNELKLRMSHAILQKALRCNHTKVGGQNWNAPEQWKTDSPRPSPASDIYGVGANLFFMLTGQEPGPYLNETGLAKMPHELNPSVSAELSSIVEKAMRYDALERYQNAEEMLLELNFRNKPAAPSLTGTRPRIVLGETSYDINGGLEIGRNHVCGNDCRRNGFKSPLNVPIDDPRMFISKHHARICRDKNGKVFITDLRSINRTAIKKDDKPFKMLQPGRKYEIEDGDELALVYSRKRGPHLKLRFLES